MASVNKVMLLGRLTRDPELRYTPKGTAVCDLGIALNRVWTDPGGEKREEVTFVDVECWQRTAELCAQYLRKGRQVFLEGRLKLDQWDDPNGQKRSKLKVTADQVTFVDGGGRGEGGPDEGGGAGAPAPRRGSYSQRGGGGGGGRSPQRGPSGPPSGPPADEGLPPSSDEPPSHMEGEPPF
jgi:single-strand DNA-binding protein